MKYKNISNKTINLKIKEEWKTIQPNKFVELSIRVREHMGLQLVKEKIVEVEKAVVLNTIENPSTPLENIIKKENLDNELKNITLIKLQRMTKDEMNDLAARHNLISINVNKMTKKEIIKKLRGSLKI